ncbi:MAG: flagellar M-ring protein FliF [Proteobacteria bacterium]|nr:flagellar M-ring protein FliF [Pseudomonadota bacterium]
MAVALLLSLLWYFVVRTPMVPAFTALKPGDAVLIVDELKRQKTPYELADNGTAILVPRDVVDATRVAVLGGDLPLKGTVGFELFSKSDIGLTEFAQKINYQRALQGELARTLMSMANVDSARVHITLPETGIFQEDHRPAKASVTVTPKPGAAIDGRTVIGIQRLVASAVNDLEAANVVVLDGSGRQLSADAPQPPRDSTGAGEPYYAEQVRNAISGLVADPALRVVVTVDPGGAAGRLPAPEGKRALPLHVAISLGAPPANDLRERIIAALRPAIGYDEQRGDALTIGRITDGAPYAVGQPVASATRVPLPERAEATWPAALTAALAVGAAMLVAAALLLAMLRLRDRAAPDHASFAARLRELLDADDQVSDGPA